MKLFLAAVFLCVQAGASILPDAVGAYHRTSSSQPVLAGRDVWDEYGLRDFESAAYENGAAKFTLTAYQLQDATGALGAFDWQRPVNSKPSPAAGLAAETPDSLLLVHGNYLLLFTGYKPDVPTLADLTGTLRNVDGGALPTLRGYLPRQDLIPNSERYVIGPAALQKFAPEIPPSVAGFHLDTEAQLGVFHSPKGDMTLAIFNYPTPQIARLKITDFQNIPGVIAKRSGPLVAVTVAPADADEAERVLSQVRYLADVTMQEHVATRKDNIGNLVVNAFILVGILLVFSTLAGLAFGGVRALMRRGSANPDAGTLTTLNL